MHKTPSGQWTKMVIKMVVVVEHEMVSPDIFIYGSEDGLALNLSPFRLLDSSESHEEKRKSSSHTHNCF